MKKINGLLATMYVNILLFIFVNLFLFSERGTDKKQSGILNLLFEHLPMMFCIWFIVFGIISLICIISIIIDFKKNDTRKLYKKMKRIKLGLIPYWILNFICYIPISSLLLVVGHGFGFFIVPLFVLASYLVLLLSSSFSIVYLLNLRRNCIISTKQLIKHSIMQLIFVVDIIDIIYIIRKLGKSKIESHIGSIEKGEDKQQKELSTICE